MFTSVSHVVPGYEPRMAMISSHMRTGQRFLVVQHCSTVAFLTVFLCVQNVGDILSARWRIPLACVSSQNLL